MELRIPDIQLQAGYYRWRCDMEISFLIGKLDVPWSPRPRMQGLKDQWIYSMEPHIIAAASSNRHGN